MNHLWLAKLPEQSEGHEGSLVTICFFMCFLGVIFATLRRRVVGLFISQASFSSQGGSRVSYAKLHVTSVASLRSASDLKGSRAGSIKSKVARSFETWPTLSYKNPLQYHVCNEKATNSHLKSSIS